MEKHTDRILWSVLVLAIGISLFLIFSPAGKSLVNDVVDNLYLTGASQVSDLPVSPQIQIKNDHVVKQNLVGDPGQIADFNKAYASAYFYGGDGSNQQRSVMIDLWPRNTNTSYYRLVPNKPHGQMYLSVTADYNVKNITSMHDDLTARSGLDCHVLVAEIDTDDGRDPWSIYQTVKYFNDSDIGTSSHGTMHNQWKLPVNADNAKVAQISIYVANIKADKITLDNLRVGLWGGSIKPVTGDD